MVLVEVALKRFAALSLLIPALALGLGGCGSGGGETASGAAPSGGDGSAGAARYATGSDLRRQLANAFDAVTGHYLSSVVVYASLAASSHK